MTNVTQADRDAAGRVWEAAAADFENPGEPPWDELEALSYAFAEHREQARAEAVEEAARVADDHVERLSTSALRMWTVQVAKAQLAARIAAAIRSLSAPLAGGEG